MAVDTGLDVLVVELDDAGGLPLLFGWEAAFDYEEAVLYEAHSGDRRVRGRDNAGRRPGGVPGGSRSATRSQAPCGSGVLEVVATAIPGIREDSSLARSNSWSGLARST